MAKKILVAFHGNPAKLIERCKSLGTVKIITGSLVLKLRKGKEGKRPRAKKVIPYLESNFPLNIDSARKIR